jgi:hypothetical protein
MIGRRLALAACAAWVVVPALQSDDFRVSRGRAGRIDVGMPIDSVFKLVGRDRARLVDVQGEGQFTPALEIRLPGATVPKSLVLIVRELPCYRVGGIEVFDPRFRTVAKVGVGSTLRELRRAYSVRLSDEEGPHAWVEKEDLNFQLSGTTRADSLTVTSIWIPIEPGKMTPDRCR